MINKTLPKISAVMTVFNGEKTLGECLEAFFSQDYPKEKIEFIFCDGGSKDKTLEIIERYRKKYPKIIKLMKNPKQFKVGRGFGADIATREAGGDFLLLIDQDNIIVGKDWLRKMAEILLNNQDICCVQSRMLVPQRGTLMEKYLGAIGIEDPFAIPYSLNAQVTLNPKNFNYNEKGFYVYEINKENFCYAGDNGFLIRRKDFSDSGGYTQDIDNFYRMAVANERVKKDKRYKVAIPKYLRIWHKTSSKLFPFIKKRGYYVRFYLMQNIKDRDFYWVSRKNSRKQNFKFVINVLSSILFVPALIGGIKMAVKEKKGFWLIHPVVSWMITANYIYSFLKVKITKKI